MYVIFPADEVVYLSYDRIIYLPSSRQPEVHTAHSDGSHISDASAPSTTNSSTQSRRSTVSESIYTNPVDQFILRSTDSSRSSLNHPSTSRARSPDLPPVKPERRKSKANLKLNIAKNKPSETTRKQSYSDFLAISRDKAFRKQSDYSQHNQTSPLPPVSPNSEKSSSSKQSSEKSPIFKFSREKCPSPRLGCDRTPNFDFDSSRLRDVSPGKFSQRSASPFFAPEEFNTRSLPRRLQSEKSSPTKKKSFFTGVRVKRTPEPGKTSLPNMATNESALRELTHPGYNEQLKAHNAVTFKLVRTVSDFTQQLGQLYDRHAEELQMLVSNFRKRNGELRKERPACPSSLFHTWETLLQEVEIDSQALGDIASILERQVSRPLLERSFHRKIQSRKVFTHRESYETIITKTEEKLAKCRQEYKNAYLSYLTSPSTETLTAYFNTHNAYVQQLHATNGMLEEYGKETLPSLLQELEEIYTDLCNTVADGVLQGAEVVSSRAMEQCRRYEGLISQCKSVSGSSDLAHLARSLPAPQGRGLVLKRPFVPPQPPPPTDAADGETPDIPNDNIPPPLKDELVIDRLSAVQLKPSHDALRKEAMDLEGQIRSIQDALDTLLRIQQRSVEASLYNKANELQEDISMKRFDLRVARIHLSALNAQKELFTSKLEGDTGARERKMSSVSQGSMKTKWLKAFKSLKTPPPETTDKKNGSAATRELLKGDPDAHNFQEYTYKKITPCDVCSQVLRGHTRQGLKCRICKMNVHLDCQDKASKCQTKARLLRRQKSTSEIETRVPESTAEEEKVLDTYSGTTINRHLSIRDNNRLQPPNAVLDRRHVQGPSSTPESSSMRRRLFAGMKSLTGFGSRSRHGSPGHRSISLPEKRNSQDASGTRPFGQPLCLGPQIQNGNSHGNDVSPSNSPSPSPSKTKSPLPVKKTSKIKK